MKNRESEKMQEDFIMLPKIDFCFKELMQSEKIRKGVISSILEVEPDEIESTELMPTILRQQYEDDKYGVLDVRVKLKNGMQMNFEMQLMPYAYWSNRILFYWAKIFTDQIKKGDSYDVLQPCIHVSILDFVHFRDDDICNHTIELVDTSTGKMYSDLLKFHILELPKLPNEIQNESGIIQWMRFFNGEKKEDFAKMAEQNEYLEEAYEYLKKLSADEIKKIEYDRREKCIRDHNSFIIGAAREAREKALVEGHAEGLAEGRMEGIHLKLIQQVIKKICKGNTPEETADMLEEDIDLVQRIYDIAPKYAPDYNEEKICAELQDK